jgi:tetratricopeptide (TPR) repeat protein
MSSLNLALSLLMIPSDSANSASFWLDKGNELCNSGQMDEALKAYEKALSIDGSLLDAWNNKALALQSLGKGREAMAAMKTAQALEPSARGCRRR